MKERLSPMDRLTAKRMQQRLCEVDEDFKRLHFAIIDLLEQKEDLEIEQANFDEHENRIGEPGYRLQQLILQDKSAKGELTAPPMNLEAAAEPSWLSRQRLQSLESILRSVKATVKPLTLGPDLDVCLVQHLQEQVGRLRAELSDVARDLLSMEHENRDLIEHESSLDKAFSDLSLQIRRLLSDRAAPSSTKEAKSGIKLPKMNVPMFNGNVLNWNTFWRQFDVAIHSKSQLDDAEKLAYLREVLKDGPARQVIESLTHDAECYIEATDASKSITINHARYIELTPAPFLMLLH